MSATGGQSATAYDFVIVGAGSSGCVLANALSAEPGVSVLLIEAGGSDRHPWVHIPKGLAFVAADHERNWHYRTEPFGPYDQVET
jgi:choline dehydrogenase